MISKERRHALRMVGPRSRASFAALPSSLQTTSFGGTYSSAVEDWLLARHKTTNSSNNHFQLCDSVPDLSSGFNENNCISISTNHSLSSSSAPRKIPLKNGALHTSNAINNNFLPNGYGTPLRMQNSNCNNRKSITSTTTSTNIEYDNDDNEVQLRRNAMNRNASHENNSNDKQNDWMYRKPTAPNDIRHSCKSIIKKFKIVNFEETKLL